MRTYRMEITTVGFVFLGALAAVLVVLATICSMVSNNGNLWVPSGLLFLGGIAVGRLSVRLNSPSAQRYAKEWATGWPSAVAYLVIFILIFALPTWLVALVAWFASGLPIGILSKAIRVSGKLRPK